MTEQTDAAEARAGMHDQPAIYPVLPSRQPDPESWALMVEPSEGTIWQTCWEYVLSHTLTEAEGAAFWTGANLIAKELAAREAAAEARGAQAVLAAVEELAGGWAAVPDYIRERLRPRPGRPAAHGDNRTAGDPCRCPCRCRRCWWGCVVSGDTMGDLWTLVWKWRDEPWWKRMWGRERMLRRTGGPAVGRLPPHPAR